MTTAYTTPTDLRIYAFKHRIPLIGVYSRDTIPKLLFNGGYIINLDSQAGHGTHWVGFFIHNDKAAYFDSFGQVPPLEIERALKRYKFVRSTKVIQNIRSGHCGLFCLFFIMYLARRARSRLGMNELVRQFGALFSDDPEDNLGILKRYLGIYH